MKTEYLAHFGNDDMVVDAARVSFDKRAAHYTPEQNARLIRYLARHKHVTPFFHPQVQLRITAPLFVARQWFRSTVGVARSEVSRRYVSNSTEFWQPLAWREKPEGSIKQGSGAALTPPQQQFCSNLYNDAVELCGFAYDQFLAAGMAPEQARAVLPQSMHTTWVETGSLAYYARICQQRLDAHAQGEIQHLARQVVDIIQPLYPVSWAALMEFTDA